MLETRVIECDLCVVGGGISGMCAAISAARHGAKTVLMHERPMLGGNASSEFRMWISGAGAANMETGIIQEIEIENFYRNPTKNYHIWDSILYDFVKREENITLLLNCSCMDATCEDGDFEYGRSRRITSVKGYQMTTQRFIEVKAKYFADCSGDSILAPLTDAKFMRGREAKDAFGEATHVEKKDDLTMGMSCLITGRETNREVEFIPSERITKLNDEHFKFRTPDMKAEHENFWYLELGGNRDSIGDTEEVRDELIGLALGTWDYIKNSGNYEYCKTYDLDFLGFLPGKRESRRMTGEYIINSNDILGDRQFDDVVAYGGWPVDDHYPDGFYHKGTPNADFKTPPCYQIPYRCLYSANIDNLFFAGRNISASHMALSSTRVMRTCGLLGQAVGTAASIATKYGLCPHGVYESKLEELQNTLMNDDCFLPTKSRVISQACKDAAISGADDSIRDGVDRVNVKVYGDTTCGVSVKNGESITYTLACPEYVESAHIVFDCDLERKTMPGGWCERTHAQRANVWLDSPQFSTPAPLCKSYTLEIVDENGKVEKISCEEKNILRAIDVKIGKKIKNLTLTVNGNWGKDESTNVFSFDFR